MCVCVFRIVDNRLNFLHNGSVTDFHNCLFFFSFSICVYFCILFYNWEASLPLAFSYRSGLDAGPFLPWVESSASWMFCVSAKKHWTCVSYLTFKSQLLFFLSLSLFLFFFEGGVVNITRCLLVVQRLGVVLFTAWISHIRVCCPDNTATTSLGFDLIALTMSALFNFL